MESRIVIVAYQPKPGKEDELLQLARTHYERLKKQELVSDRLPILMQAKNGTIIEVFEWKSANAIKQAHTNPEVQKMWTEYSQVCEYIPVSKVEETSNLFCRVFTG